MASKRTQSYYWLLGFNLISNFAFFSCLVIGILSLYIPAKIGEYLGFEFNKLNSILITLVGLFGSTMVVGFWYLIKEVESSNLFSSDLFELTQVASKELNDIHYWVKHNEEEMHTTYLKSKDELYASFLSELKKIKNTPEVFVTHFEKVGTLPYDSGDSTIEKSLMIEWIDKVKNKGFSEVKQIVHLSTQADYNDNYNRLENFKDCTNFKLNVIIGIPIEPYLDMVIVKDNFMILNFSKDVAFPFDTEFGIVLRNKALINDFIQYFNIWWARSLPIKDRNYTNINKLNEIYRLLPETPIEGRINSYQNSLLGILKEPDILILLERLIEQLNHYNSEIYTLNIERILSDAIKKIATIGKISIKIKEEDYIKCSNFVYKNSITKIMAVSNESRSEVTIFDNWNSQLGKQIMEFNVSAIKRGVQIERIFILTKIQMENPEIKSAIADQIRNNITVRTILITDIEDSEAEYDFIISDNNLLMFLDIQKDILGYLTRDLSKISQYSNIFNKLIYKSKKLTYDKEL